MRVAGAHAAQFGEVGRFGCYTEATCTGPHFGFPVGFAVDSENDVYVLDRVIDEPEAGELQYRLQKLAGPSQPDAGAVLGTTLLPLEHYTPEDYAAAHPLIGLAVDSAQHKVYALVESIGESEAEVPVPVASKLVAWATVPVQHGSEAPELPAASGYAVDPLTHAGLVANSTVLQPSGLSEDLYAPEALAVATVKGHQDAVIEAQKGVAQGFVGGATILQRVETENGQLEGNWLASSAPNGEAPNGLVAKGDESFGVDLMAGEVGGFASRLLDVSSTGATAKLATDEPSNEEDVDQALTLDGAFTTNYREGADNGRSGAASLMTYTAGSPIAELANGDFAARYAHLDYETDHEAALAPWNATGTPLYFWTDGRGGGIPNTGVRIFNADGQIVSTVGGGAKDDVCDIASAQVAVAAGANSDNGSGTLTNTFFVLTQPNPSEAYDGDELIEFAEGAAHPCPAPSGEVEVNGTPAAAVTVLRGEDVKFSAESVERAGETPFAFEWNFGEAGEGYTLTSKMEAPKFDWAKPEATHKYEVAGLYHASVQITGDYGVSVIPVTMTVEAAQVEAAEFAVPSAVVAKSEATFDAVESKATPGAHITNYHWEFGDGTPAVNSTTTTESHEFAGAGSYEVTLTITDSDKATSSVTHKVTVAAASSGGGSGSGGSGSSSGGSGSGGSSGSGGGSSSTPPTVIPPATGIGPVSPTGVAPIVQKPLTRAQKLAKALKTCHRAKSKKKRASCEKQARREYGPKAKPKKKKK